MDVKYGVTESGLEVAKTALVWVLWLIALGCWPAVVIGVWRWAL